MKKLVRKLNFRLIVLAVLLVLNITLIIFIPPASGYIIFLFILSISLFMYSVLKLLVKKKFAVLSALFTAVILTLLALRLLDLINILLAASLFAGLLILLR